MCFFTLVVKRDGTVVAYWKIIFDVGIICNLLLGLFLGLGVYAGKIKTQMIILHEELDISIISFASTYLKNVLRFIIAKTISI